MGFDKQKSAGYLANHMARLFAHHLQERIKPLGIAPAQFAVLLELWQEQGLTQRDLVKRLAVEQATMANTVGRMERDGLVVRKPDPKDKRAARLYLTNKAQDVKAAATGEASGVNKLALAGLSGDEAELFLDMMRRTINALNKRNTT